jgi:integrase
MPRVAKGCVEQLPSGSWRARVYAGIDPITKREIRLKATAKTEQQAHIELGRLLNEASEGRTPESDATVAKLLDEYAPIAPWDVSTRQTNEGFIRRTIKPALGPMKVRKVRGPILGAEALRRPGVQRQAVHRAPQRPGPGDQSTRLPPSLAAGH